MIDLQPIQTAIYVALTTAPATYPVHDAVPQNTPYPYITIGPPSGEPDENLAVDSVDAAWSIDGWSRSAGKPQALAMIAFIRARLHNQAIGGGVWACTEEFQNVIEDPKSTYASRLYHAITRYRVRAE